MAQPSLLALAALIAAQGSGAQEAQLRLGETLWRSLAREDPRVPDRGPSKRFLFEADEDGPVTISLNSFDFDAFLVVERDGAEKLFEDDDGGVESNAKVVLEAESGVRYRIVAAASGPEAWGDFHLSATRGRDPPLTPREEADAAIAYRFEAAHRALERSDPRGATRHRSREGELRFLRGQVAEAKEAFEAALGLARETKDPLETARALVNLGRVATERGEYETARQRHEEALALFRGLGDGVGEGRTLSNLGVVAEALGDLPTARSRYEQALEVARRAGDRPGQGAALGKIGVLLHRFGDFRESVRYLEECLAIARLERDPWMEAGALRDIGDVLHSQGDLARAREALEKGWALARDLGDPLREMDALERLAAVYGSLGDLPRQRESCEKALDLARERGNPEAKFQSLLALGALHRRLADPMRARASFEEALNLARGAQNPFAEAAAKQCLGDVALDLQDRPTAKRLFEESLAIAREVRDEAGQANSLLRLGALEEDPSAADRLFEEALSLSGARDATVDQLVGFHLERRNHGKARELAEEALAAAKASGNRSREGASLVSIGEADTNLGDFDAARVSYEAALRIARDQGARGGERAALLGLGWVHRGLRDYEQARERFEAAIDLARELGYREGEAWACGGLGDVLWTLGDLSRALRCHERRLALAQELGMREEEGWAWIGRGVVQLDLGRPKAARESYQKALEVFSELGGSTGEALAFHDLGVVYFRLGDLEGAEREYEKALGRWREIRASEGEAMALGHLAVVHYRRGDDRRATECADAALLLYGRLGRDEYAVNPLLARAGVALRARDGTAGAAALREAEEVLARLSVRARAAGGSASFGYALLLSADEIAQDLVALGAKEGSDDPDKVRRAVAEGFLALGRSKGRSLLSGIVEHRRGARSAPAIQFRRERANAGARRDAVLDRIARAVREGKSSGEIDALRREAQDWKERLDSLGRVLREVSPRDAALDLPQGVEPDAVRRAMPSGGTLLVEYAEGQDRLYAYVFSEGGLTLLDLGARGEIRRRVEAFLSSVSDPGSLGGVEEVAESGHPLFESLLAPALARAPANVERLVIVPTGSLSGVPFEALPTSPAGEPPPRGFGDLEFVIDRYEVCYAPSSPVLVELAALGPRRAGGRVLVLADPVYPSESEQGPDVAKPAALSILGGSGSRAAPAPGDFVRLEKTREEARAIADLLVRGEESGLVALTRRMRERSGSLDLPTLSLHLGAAAAPKRLAGDLKPYAVLHLAGHGYIDPELPQGAGLAFSFGEGEEGYFTLGDALELDLDANLVVLSACDTARGEFRSGEGVESMARAFMYSGARAVVASLWQVPDSAAADAMRAFYRRVLEEELHPSEALRAAKFELRRSRELRGVAAVVGGPSSALDSGHPFFWAPFIYIGLPP